jgi:hypothetical protein
MQEPGLCQPDAARAARLKGRALALLVGVLLAFALVAVPLNVPPPVVRWVYTLALFPVVGLSLALARFDRVTIAIVMGGVALYLGYLHYTDFRERNYDADDQLHYIQYILEHHARPPATYCLICHHPPLYYGLGAAIYRFFDATQIAPATLGLQLFSLACHLVFLGYALATARRFLPVSRDLHLAAALIVFWPYSIENSVRVHNDSLASTLMCAATYYLVRWGQDEEPRDLYRAALVTGVGLLTKSTAYAVAAALGVMLVVRFFRSTDKVRFAGMAVVAGLLLASGFLLNARGKESPTSSDAVLCHKILGTACDIKKHQWVDNRPINYLYLDPLNFLREPYALAGRDGTARALFWNHLLKSSLFGTHNTTPDAETAYQPNRAIAFAMNALLLGMDAYLAITAAVYARRQALRRFAVVLVSLASCIAFMIGFRALIPAPHHTDFRHIFSTLVLVATLYAAAVARVRVPHPRLARLGQGLALVFVALSAVYFLPKQDWVIRVTRHTVERSLAAESKLAPAGTPWDAEGNLVIEPNEIVNFALPDLPTVRGLDVSLDGNDHYRVDIVGDETRSFTLGPPPGPVKVGLARYVERIEPPVAHVRAVRVEPLSGDYAYSLGHLLLEYE